MADTDAIIRRLSDAEKRVLENLSEKPPSRRIKDRAKAILLSSRGERTTRILQAVPRDRETVLRWIAAYNRRGAASLACSASTLRI
jgi:hypothetical protein